MDINPEADEIDPQDLEATAEMYDRIMGKCEPTPPPWRFHEQGEPNQYAILKDGPNGPQWVLGLLHNGEMMPAKQRANLAFIVQAVNNHARLLFALTQAVEIAEAGEGPNPNFYGTEINQWKSLIQAIKENQP